MTCASMRRFAPVHKHSSSSHISAEARTCKRQLPTLKPLDIVAAHQSAKEWFEECLKLDQGVPPGMIYTAFGPQLVMVGIDRHTIQQLPGEKVSDQVGAVGSCIAFVQ